MRGPTRGLALAVALLVVVAVFAGSGSWEGGTSPPAPPRNGEVSSGDASREAARQAESTGNGPLLLVLAPGLSLDDLTGGQHPHLKALAREGAVGWMNVTTVPGHADLASACLTLGAGVRVVAPPGAGRAFTGRTLSTADRRWLAGQARASPAELLSGVGANDRFRTSSSTAGRLGTLLVAAGRCVGAAIAGHRYGGGELFLAVMDAQGAVPAGIVGAPLLRQAPDRPYGIAAGCEALAGAGAGLLEVCDVVAVDAGDMERARRYAPLCLPSPARDHLAAALQDLDRLVGRLWPGVRARGGSMLLVSPVPPTDGSAPFGLVLAAGRHWPHGSLTSGSTRIAGLVTNTDFLPTVLALSKVSLAPPSLPGRAFEVSATGEPADLRRLSAWSARAENVRGPAWNLLRAVLLFLVGCAAIPSGRPLARRLLPAPMLLMLALLLAGDVVAPPTPLRSAVHGLVGLVAVVTVLRFRSSRCQAPSAANDRRAPDTASCLLGLFGVTALLLLGELLTGSHLLRWSPLGYSLALGARYYGIGNEALGVLIGAVLVMPFAAVALLPEHRHLVAWGGVLLYGLTVALVGSPAAGAKFGGTLAAAVGFALALPALAGRRVSPRRVLGALAVCLVVAALFAAWDAGRPASAQSHVGRLVTAVRTGGVAPFAAAVAGKATTASRVSLSLWGVIALAEAAVGWALLRRTPTTGPLHAGLALLVPSAVALLLFNDSGVIAAALLLAPLPVAAAALAEEEAAHPADSAGFRQNTE